MRKKNFLKNEHARIPFSVIGIFLILGSSFASVYVTNLETEKAIEISQTIDFNEIETFLRLAEADMATALNLASLKGLKEIGERPVLFVSEEDKVDNPYGSNPEEINSNRVKSIIMEDLNMYLSNSYRNGNFNNGRYIINVQISDGEQYPISSRDEITFNYVDMKLDRSFSNDWIGPPRYPSHKTYWVANIPVDVDIIKIENDQADKIVLNRTIDVSTIITCRYNLLKALVDEYQDEIGGSFIDGTENSLFTVCTILFNIYSLARGLLHWSSGKPKNVVDNDDLEFMVNTGLLLQQGFVFGSVDPMALVGLATSMGSSENNAKNDVYNSFEVGSFDWNIDTSDITNVLPEDDGSGMPTTDIAPDINITEIAFVPLYDVNSIILIFENDAGHQIPEKLINPKQEDIEDISKEKLKQGYFLNNSYNNFEDIEKKQKTVDLIKQIITTVYSTDLEVQVERGQNLISSYQSAGYTINTGVTPWISTTYTFNGSIEKPAKDNIQPGDILYGEFYYVNNEEILIKMILNEYSNYDVFKNDIKDVFYRNANLNDENLEDTIDLYKDMVLTDTNLSKWLDDKDISGTMNTSTVFGSYNSWVETQAWQALEGIFEEIKKIELDPSITFTKYPDPLSLMNAAKEDLLKKYEQNMSSYLNIDNYRDGSLFISTGKKAVYCARHWYVKRVHDDIETRYSGLESDIDNQINNELNERGIDGSAKGVRDTLSGPAMGEIQNGFTIPLGYDITLTGEWTESIRIAVDQNPDYLKPDEIIEVTGEENNIGDEEFYALKLRNTCTLGPTGFPFLPPTPITPWILTFNIWIIDVAGEYKEFKVVDTTDETHFDPLLGHEAQIYIRKHEVIKEGGIIIGENTRLNFAFTTLAFAFVPPLQHMVGDTEGDLIEESKGWP